MQPSRPARSVFEYVDYRKFLQDHYQANKKDNSSFSYRYIGGKIGLDAGSFYRILKGERNLDPEMAGRLARVFGLAEKERDYFETLVLYVQAKSHAEKNHFLERIFRLKKVMAKPLEKSQYEFYKEWFYSATRELLNFLPFAGDYRKLARILKPAITPSQAKQAVRLLEDLGLITTDSEGKVSLTNSIITSGEGIKAISINNLHISMAELAVRSIQNTHPKERDFSGLTLSLSESGFEKVKAKLQQFRMEVLEIAREDDSVNRVYQVNLQAFPLSHPYQSDDT